MIRHHRQQSIHLLPKTCYPSGVRFEPATKTLEISVRELAEDQGFRPIGFERGEGWSRLGLGSEIHARVLSERRTSNPVYRSEVHLKVPVAVEDWTAMITGRLDGCVQGADGQWLIEEFKSLHFQTEEIRTHCAGFDRHRRQLLFYCHLWRALGNQPVSGVLIYVDIASGRERTFAAVYDEQEQERELAARLARRLAVWRYEQAARERKAAVAVNLPFPHAAPRPGQQHLIEAVRNTLQSGGNLLAEAPTGSGKTAAGLHPAMAEGLARGRQVFFLTSKTLQQRMAVSALTAMNTAGAFRTIQIRAKERMCANERVLCHEDFCPYARNYPEKMMQSRILDRLESEQAHHDPDAIFAEAKREAVCPFEVQLELAGRADAVVADYNYIFEPGVALRHLADDGLENTILLVDEAHNLPDRARRIFSPELTEKQFRDADDWMLFQSGKLFDELGQTVRAGIALLHECAAGLSGKEAIAETEVPEEALIELWKQWEPKFLNYLVWKRERKLALEEDSIVALHFTLQRFLAVLRLFGRGFACVIERRAEGVRLALVCLDPARALAPVFRASASTVLLSATLSPAESIHRMLGLEKDRTETISLPPPFPRENRRVMILPQVQTTFAARERNYGPIAELTARMADAQNGNVLVLFPSYQFLEKVAARLPGTRGRLVVQKPALSEFERREILSALEGREAGGVVLLAVLGGMYAEGVDYPGDLLSCVFIVSPALPQVSFERELLRRYFDEEEGAGFQYAYLQPGMTRVVQAAGRLIRSETDRGVIALLCQRFLQEPYVRHLPRDWYEDSPLELITRNPAGEVRAFFEKFRGHSVVPG